MPSRDPNMRCSMTDGYDCYQNALAERVNGILKDEFLLQRPANLTQASLQFHADRRNGTPKAVKL